MAGTVVRRHANTVTCQLVASTNRLSGTWGVLQNTVMGLPVVMASISISSRQYVAARARPPCGPLLPRTSAAPAKATTAAIGTTTMAAGVSGMSLPSVLAMAHAGVVLQTPRGCARGVPSATPTRSVHNPLRYRMRDEAYRRARGDARPWWASRVNAAKRRARQKLPPPIDPSALTSVQFDGRALPPAHVQAWVINWMRERMGITELDARVFAAEPLRADLVQRVVEWQRAKARQGTHKVKRRHEVSGSGRKPYRQKGTGRARRGTNRAPHHRGGGVVMGPVPRDHGFDVPKRVRRAALAAAFSAKFSEAQLHVLDGLVLDSHKTSALLRILDGWECHSLLVVHGAGELPPEVALAARNVRWIDFVPAHGANVLDTVRHHTVAITLQGVEELSTRLLRDEAAEQPMLESAEQL